MNSPTEKTLDNREREYATIKETTRIFGRSRSEIYRLAPHYPGLLVKAGRTTLVNLEMMREIMASLPHASIRPAPTVASPQPTA